MNEQPQSPTGIDLDDLVDLLNAKRWTAGWLETAVRQHPELLGPDAQMWLSILARGQQTPEARAALNDLGRILGRLRTESLQAVISDESSLTRRSVAQNAREARLQAEREKFLTWRKKPAVESTAAPMPLPLPSLAEVVAYLRAVSTAERSRPYGRDLLNPHAPSDSIPAYLFRGESGIYKSTYSSMARLSASSRAVEDVARIRQRLVAALSEKCELTPPQAVGYLQHYGYPTDYIDVTSDVSVAASFASWLRVGDAGALCVVPTEPLVSRGSLIDLRPHPLAPRPRLQSAFAIHAPDYPDLKHPLTVEALQLTWIEFRLTALDAERFRPNFSLLDARSDQVAGLIWLLIGDCAKFNDEAASLISKRISPALVFSVAAHDGSMVLVSGDDVAPDDAMSDDEFRRGKYEFWSDAFAAPERKPLPPELETTIGRTDVKPGDVLHVLTLNAISRVHPMRREGESQ